MPECLTDAMLERYRHGLLDPQRELVNAEAHLGACPACQAALAAQLGDARTAAARNLLPSPAEPTCPEDELLTRFVAGQADAIDREVVESHAAECARCQAELASLQAFAEQMRRYDWAPAEAAARPPSLWQRLRGGGGASPAPRWLAPALAGTGGLLVGAAAAALLLLGLTAPVRREVAALRGQVRDLQQSQAALRREAAEAAALREQLARLQRDRAPVPVPTPPPGPVVADRQAPPEPPPAPTAPRAPAPAPRPRVALQDAGGSVILTPAGQLQGAPALPRGLERAVRQALVSGSAPLRKVLPSLSSRAGTLMGEGGGGAPFVLGSPVGEVVESDRPTFRWTPLADATGYSVTVVDDRDQEEVATSGPVPGVAGGAEVEWSLPASEPPLRRGRVYRWYVVATRRDGQQVQSPDRTRIVRFLVLDAARQQEVQHARNLQPPSHLALGVACARAGLFAAAEREFAALLEANPDSPVARRLLRSVRKARTSQVAPADVVPP